VILINCMCSIVSVIILAFSKQLWILFVLCFAVPCTSINFPSKKVTGARERGLSVILIKCTRSIVSVTILAVSKQLWNLFVISFSVLYFNKFSQAKR
jgi:hypothetical protein